MSKRIKQVEGVTLTKIVNGGGSLTDVSQSNYYIKYNFKLSTLNGQK